MGKEDLDLGFRHLSRMALVVEENETFEPIDVGFVRANGIVFAPYGIANLIQELLWSIFHRVSHLTNEGFRVHSSKAQI